MHSSIPAPSALDCLSLQFPQRMSPAASPQLGCCCGRDQCAYLEYNSVALESLEKDVRTAARIGQALLARHENFVADAEAERAKMTASIDHLETAKKEVEATNVKAVDENRHLLDQLEDLNHTVSESDTHIQSLNATLQSTRLELQRLTILAGRTAMLEQQLSAMETEQANLRNRLATTQENERSAVHRWKRAERTIGDLQGSIDRIESEARKEHERHVDVVGRIERRRAVEKELETSTSLLTGAAAPTLGTDKAGSSVVSHFVKDILQDNANLQLGIVELRRLLTSSNQEVENLRERLLLHQPILLENEDDGQRSTLGNELAERPPKDDLPELHVHHHYHSPTKTEVQRGPATTHRRSKKRRSLVASGTSTPSSGWQTSYRATRPNPRPTPSSSAATILSQTSATIPPTQRSLPHRWSTHSSTVATSTVPSSPQSMYRGSSMFDCIDNVFESSRPTSPESNSLVPPMFFDRHKKSSLDISFRNVSTPAAIESNYTTSPVALGRHGTEEPNIEDEECLTDLDLTSTGRTTIVEESVDDTAADTASTTGPISMVSANSIYSPTGQPQLQLRRPASHESLLSISGMDIHTLRDRPSQMLSGQRFHPRMPFNISSPSLLLTSSKPVVNVMTARAHPAYQRRIYGSSNYNRSILSGVCSGTNIRSESNQTAVTEKPTLGKRMGGWVWGKFGVTSTAAAGSLRAKAALAAIDERAAGGTQPTVGRQNSQTSSNVEATEVNTTLLQETLGE
ncbi:MAG: hypothetical protein FRX48_00829 [Lasallia pustulata]|uniref:Uncharacterized protein n=1 Tax=Lasallia pustulata TaxID=136370 RepID=A0A5M8Q3X9_9LECA|nr:MAG: hypothetical protein FRX48_00829 [Lasallia pustulata]